MSVKFKCKQSGTVAEFEHEHDIVAMRKHPDYEEVKVVEKAPAAAKKAAVKTVEPKGEDDGN